MAAIVRVLDTQEDKITPMYSVDAREAIQKNPSRFRPATKDDERKVKAQRENLAKQNPSLASQLGVEREGAVRGGDLTESGEEVDPLE